MINKIKITDILFWIIAVILISLGIYALFR